MVWSWVIFSDFFLLFLVFWANLIEIWGQSQGYLLVSKIWKGGLIRFYRDLKLEKGLFFKFYIYKFFGFFWLYKRDIDDVLGCLSVEGSESYRIIIIVRIGSPISVNYEGISGKSLRFYISRGIRFKANTQEMLIE